MGNYKSTFWHTRPRRCCVHLYLFSSSSEGQRPTREVGFHDSSNIHAYMNDLDNKTKYYNENQGRMVSQKKKCVRASNLRVYTLT